MELEQEIKTYEAKKDQLLADLEGRFVLIKGEDIAADFANYSEGAFLLERHVVD